MLLQLFYLIFLSLDMLPHNHQLLPHLVTLTIVHFLQLLNWVTLMLTKHLALATDW